jgi:hypothetical protein
MPGGVRKAQAIAKRQVAVEAIMRVTHIDECKARALLSQSRWNVGAATDKFFRREESRLLKVLPPESDSAVGAMDTKTMPDASDSAEMVGRVRSEYSGSLKDIASTGHSAVGASCVPEPRTGDPPGMAGLQDDEVIDLTKWEDPTEAWRPVWEKELASLMRVCDISREEAARYLELEDVEYDFDDAVCEDLRLRRLQFALLEQAGDRDAMIAARDAFVQYRLRWVRYRHESRGGLIPGDVVHDAINMMVRNATESIAAGVVVVPGPDASAAAVEYTCSDKMPASSSDFPGANVSLRRMMAVCCLSEKEAFRYLEESSFDIHCAIGEFARDRAGMMDTAKQRDDVIGVTVVLTQLKQVYANWYFSRAEHETPDTVSTADFLADTLLRLLRYGCDVVREIREANQRVHEENNRRRAEARRLVELEHLQERQRANAQLQEREALILARLEERRARDARLIVELRDASSVEEMHRVADAYICDRDALHLRIDALIG